MKLDRSYWKRRVFDTHDHTIFTFSGDLQIRRQGFTHGIEGVIPARCEFRREVSEDTPTKYMDPRCFAMHWA